MLNILAAVDGSEHAASALELASGIASKYGATLHLFYVIEYKDLPEALRRFADAEHIEGAPPHIHQLIAERVLEAGAVTARELGVDDVKTVVRVGDPAEEIVAYAKSAEIDMIVMGSRGLSDLRGLMLGSVSHKVSELASCTCVTVR